MTGLNYRNLSIIGGKTSFREVNAYLIEFQIEI